MSDEKDKNIGSPEDRMVEECGEVLQAIIKGKRFGWERWHPDDPTQTSNLERLQLEMDDLWLAFSAFKKAYDKAREVVGCTKP